MYILMIIVKGQRGVFMNIQIVCKKCGEREIYLQYRGMQVGAYCSNCGSWIKWVGKKELPLLKSRGLKVFPDGQPVSIKRDAPLGVIIEDERDVKPSTFQKKDSYDNDAPFISNTTENKDLQEWEQEYKNRVRDEGLVVEAKTDSLAAEVEIEKRVKARLIVEKESIDEEIEKRVQERLKNEKPQETYDGYCSVCDGQPLKSFNVSDSSQVVKLDVTIYDGVLTITNEDGSILYGLYEMKRCPECGRPFSK